MLRAAIIGVGNMGRNHARVLSEIEGVELVAVADKHAEANKNGKRYWKRFYTDYRKLIENERPDLITLAVPTIHHHAIGLAVLKARIPLLIEKPLAYTISEAEELIAAAHKHKTLLTVGHIERFNPAVQELQARIKAGELGRIYKVKASRVGPIPPRIQDVGVVIDLAVHDIDVFRYLIGSEPVRVYAETAQRLHSHKEDLLAGVIKFADDTIAYLNVNWLTPTNIRQLTITGEKGLFVLDYLDQRLQFYENVASQEEKSQHIVEGKMIRFKIAKREPLRNELEHFIDCVRKRTQPLVTGEDGKRVLEIAHMLLRSAKEGRVVHE
ncbi:gfo/Idh/MocA family oxidoreductase [Candidatus Woesearchaeota archaeon]|nr:MAG: gfo/Idh/MocA family oxidoreductase [Candidatus Woesearchaeota archaeon]